MAEIKILKPSFYDDFVCKANKCRNTCCQGWFIALNKRDYCKMKNAVRGTKLEKSFSNTARRIKSKLGYAELITNGENKACKYLTEEGLCDFYLTCGGSSMPDICKIYPRKMLYNNNVFYKILSPTCEAVMEYALSLKNGIDFDMDYAPHTAQIYSEDHAMYNLLVGIHKHLDFFTLLNLFVDIMQNRTCSIEERLILLALAFNSLPNKQEDEFDYTAWANKYSIFSTEYAKDSLGEIKGDEAKFVLNILNMFDMWTLFTNTDKEYISDIKNFLEYEKISENMTQSNFFNLEKYQKAKEKFNEAFKDKQYVWENYLILAFLDIVDNKTDNLIDAVSVLIYTFAIAKLYLIVHCDELNSNEKIIDLISFVSRSTLHSSFAKNCVSIHNELNDGSVASLVNVIYH